MGISQPTPIIIFDLDDTLVDRRSAFARWAQAWADRRGLGPEGAAWLIEADLDSDRPRTELFSAAVRRFDLGDAAADLVDEFYRDIPSYFVPDRAVVDGLERLRERGWKIGVATNGSRAQRPKMAAAGLLSHVDGVCVSEEIGVSKPDPGIFAAVAEAAGATLDGGWMAGDSPTSDIGGGRDAGLRTIWISRGREWTTEGFRPNFIAPTIVEAFGHLLAAEGVSPGS